MGLIRAKARGELVEALAPHESDPEKWNEILEDNGYVILVDDDDPRFFILVSL